MLYSFVGRTGTVTNIIDPEDGEIKYVVTFNDNRSSYVFDKEHLELITSKSNYKYGGFSAQNIRVQFSKRNHSGLYYRLVHLTS